MRSGAGGTVQMVRAQQLADIGGAVLRAGTRPVDEKALSADRATDVTNGFGGLTEDLHREDTPENRPPEMRLDGL